MNDIFKAALQTAMVGRIKQKELAEKTQISVPYLNDLYRGRRAGQETVRRRIAEALGYDDYESFLDIGRQALGLAPLRKPKCAVQQIPLSPELNSFLPLTPETPEEASQEQRAPFLLPPIAYAGTKKLQAFLMGEDSMEPLIAQSGIVLADVTQNDPQNLHNGHIYVLNLDISQEQFAIKRLKWVEAGKLLAIESENKLYATIYRKLEEVQLIGRVLWSWRIHT